MGLALLVCLLACLRIYIYIYIYQIDISAQSQTSGSQIQRSVKFQSLIDRSIL